MMAARGKCMKPKIITSKKVKTYRCCSEVAFWGGDIDEVVNIMNEVHINGTVIIACGVEQRVAH